VPEVELEAAYEDQAIVTKQTESGLGLSSSSQPAIMAEMLEELRLEPGQRVLEIGAGTGYNAALVQHVVGDEGRVTTVDIDPETATRARRALRGTGVKVVTADGRDGHARGAPYDRVIVTASASEIPRAWLEQLAPGGLLEVPLRVGGSGGFQLIPTLRREGERLRSVSVIAGGFMPLRTAPDDLSAFGSFVDVRWTEGSRTTRLLTIGGVPPREAAARRLVSTACSPPRSRRLSMRASAKGLAIYLAVRGPAGRLVGVLQGNSYLGGIAAADGTSLALLTGWPTTSKILVYGTEKAADELEVLAAEWAERGRPEADDIGLTVSFRNGTSALRIRIGR
jgi:protein-L-isoaspartate(D-aspartate) O-methyltransferase